MLREVIAKQSCDYEELPPKKIRICVLLDGIKKACVRTGFYNECTILGHYMSFISLFKSFEIKFFHLKHNLHNTF